MVQITVNTPGTSRNVTFQETTDLEKQIILKVQEVLGEQFTDDVILQAIRKHTECKNDDSFISNVIEDIMNSNDRNTADDAVLGPIIGPEKASTASGAGEVMEVVPYNPTITTNKNIDKEESDLQRALQESLKVSPQTVHHSQAPVDLEEMIRNPLLSTGLNNAGNTCWFNCLAQLLYSLPKFRSLIYHCVPATWHQTPIVNIEQEHVLHADLLVRFRRLFAELQFSEMTFIEAGRLLEVVDILFCRSRVDIKSTIGTQQDATEMLMLILDWLGTALNAALNAHLHPELCIDNIEGNFVVADSTTQAPNSDVVGTAPPGYEDSFVSASNSVQRPAQSRPNSPIRTISEFVMPLVPKPEQMTIEELMDTSEGPSGGNRSRLAPLPAKMPRIPSQKTVVSETEKEFVGGLKQQFDDIFAATCYSAAISDDNTASAESEIRNCPQFFHLQISYGNLHDALEASTYDTSRHSVSHVRNLYGQLPAVIFMGLSRFGYKNGPSKLHDKFTFPRTFFMDRYLKSNAEQVSALRRRQLEYREQLAVAKAQRKGLVRYPYADGGEARLCDVFETALQALSNSRDREEPENDIGLTGPLFPSTSSPYKTNADSKFIEDKGKIFPKFNPEQFPSIAECRKTLQTITSSLHLEEEQCLQREAELEQLIEQVYEIDSLQKHKYELHAMIVHSGEANRGHYWTYRIKKSIDGSESWEKLNDRKTDIVDWSQVESDAFGNNSRDSPSAYLLMYVRSDAEWLMATDRMTETEALNNLPTDLQEMVSMKRAQFKDDLRRFREEKAAAIEAKETAHTFSWFGGEHDENANPKGSLDDRLGSVHVEIAKDSELSEMARITSRMWHSINSIEPHRFESESALLNHHLHIMMSDEKGGMAFIEELLGYPVIELREDAENDIDRVYSRFMTHYLDWILEKQCLSDSSQFVAFIKSRLNRVHVSIIRFLLVRAVSLADLGVLSQKARAELEHFKLNHADAYMKTMKVVLLLVNVFEVATLSAWACHKALEHFKTAMDKKKLTPSRMESNFLAMVSARVARVCNRLIYQETAFVFDNAFSFLRQDLVETCTVLPLLSSIKQLVHHLVKNALDLNNMEFYLTERERRVSLDDIVLEIRFAVSRVHAWFRAIEQAEETTGVVGVEERLIDIRKIYGSLNTVFEMVSVIGEVTNDKTKSSCVNTIREAITILEENEEKGSDIIRCNPLSLDRELSQIGELCLEPGKVDDRVTKILEEMQEIISSSYGA